MCPDQQCGYDYQLMLVLMLEQLVRGNKNTSVNTTEQYDLNSCVWRFTWKGEL